MPGRLLVPPSDFVSGRGTAGTLPDVEMLGCEVTLVGGTEVDDGDGALDEPPGLGAPTEYRAASFESDATVDVDPSLKVITFRFAPLTVFSDVDVTTGADDAVGCAVEAVEGVLAGFFGVAPDVAFVPDGRAGAVSCGLLEGCEVCDDGGFGALTLAGTGTLSGAELP